MLEVRDVDVTYGDAQALWGVSFFVGDREIVALVGSNGAGKTSIIRTISGIQRPTRGTILFDGRRCDTASCHEVVDLGISLVPEGRRLFPAMTVMENLELGGYLKRARKTKDDKIGYVFRLFPVLEQRRSQVAGTLSGGGAADARHR